MDIKNKSFSPQSFGMALKIDSRANLALLKRQNNEEIFWKLNAIKLDQKNNDIDILLSAQKSRLNAVLGYKGSVYEKHTEGLFRSLFSSPVKFIQKMCKKADKLFERKKNAEILYKAIEDLKKNGRIH